MRRPYSRRELLALIRIEAELGKITYQNPSELERLFYELTGCRRSSGPLYMAMWRIKQGGYDDIINDNVMDIPELPFYEDDSSSSLMEVKDGNKEDVA